MTTLAAGQTAGAVSTVDLCVVDREGAQHHLPARVGEPLMHALREAGLDIEASCGGCCICATCHIYLEGEWPGACTRPESDEKMLLDELLYAAQASRLACQLKVSRLMSGLTVRLAPAEL